MLQRVFASIKALFRSTPQKPSNATITPLWVVEGQRAAQALKAIPTDEFSQTRLLDEAFKRFYAEHRKACRQAGLPEAFQKEAYQQFKQGWLNVLKSNSNN